MNFLLQDLRFVCRTLLKNPGFTAIAVVTNTSGIGANTAIFSIINALRFRPLPTMSFIADQPTAALDSTLGRQFME